MTRVSGGAARGAEDLGGGAAPAAGEATGAVAAAEPLGAAAAAALAAIPVALLWLDPQWIYSTLFHDPWIYYGYYLNPGGMIARFPNLYYSTRLSLIVPGSLVHRVLPPVAAHVALHLPLYWACVFSVEYLVRVAAGRRAAYLAALAMGTDVFFLGAIGHDYSDAFGITSLALTSAMALAAARSRSGRGPAWMAGAGACAAAALGANLGYAVFLPYPLGLHLVARGPGRRGELALEWLAFLAGGAGVFAAFALYFWSYTGRFWFLAGSVRFIARGVRRYSQQGNPFKTTDPRWVAWAVWLAMPCAVLVGCLPRALAWLRRGPLRRPDPATWYVLQFSAVWAFVLAVEVATKGTLIQAWFYASLLIPFAYLAFGALVSRLAGALSPGGYRAVAAAGTVVLVASAASPWPYDPAARWPVPVILLAVVPAVAGLAALTSLPAGRAAGVVGFTLLAASQFAARATFREDKSVTIFGAFSPNEEYKVPLALERLTPYVHRMHAYDPARRDVLLAVDDVVRFVRQADAADDVRYWFDLADPHGVLFDNIACTRNYLRGMLNFNFPNIKDEPLCDGTTLAPGRTVAVLSSHPSALSFARIALSSVGLGARLIARKEVRRGPIRFDVYVLETERP